DCPAVVNGRRSAAEDDTPVRGGIAGICSIAPYRSGIVYIHRPQFGENAGHPAGNVPARPVFDLKDTGLTIVNTVARAARNRPAVVERGKLEQSAERDAMTAQERAAVGYNRAAAQRRVALHR